MVENDEGRGEKDLGGRPLAFETPEELQKAVDSYFAKGGDAWVDMGESGMQFMPTMSGLALALGVDRKTITNYGHKDGYFPTIKKARTMVENALEKRLYFPQPTGVIFNLKNNFGWKDKTEVDNTSSDGSMTPSKIIREVVSASKD